MDRNPCFESTVHGTLLYPHANLGLVDLQCGFFGISHALQKVSIEAEQETYTCGLKGVAATHLTSGAKSLTMASGLDF